MISRWIMLCGLAFVGTQACAAAREQDAQAATRFVQGFYDWYVPVAVRGSDRPAMDVVLGQRASALAPDLLEMLRRDSAAQARTTGEIVGLDFDPFLNAQDPCESYQTAGVTRAGESYRVSIVSVCSGARSSAAEVIADVVHRNGRWEFANFHYPAMRSDLVTILTRLASARQSR